MAYDAAKEIPRIFAPILGARGWRKLSLWLASNQSPIQRLKHYVQLFLKVIGAIREIGLEQCVNLAGIVTGADDDNTKAGNRRQREELMAGKCSGPKIVPKWPQFPLMLTGLCCLPSVKVKQDAKYFQY